MYLSQQSRHHDLICQIAHMLRNSRNIALDPRFYSSIEGPPPPPSPSSSQQLQQHRQTQQQQVSGASIISALIGAMMIPKASPAPVLPISTSSNAATNIGPNGGPVSVASVAMIQSAASSPSLRARESVVVPVSRTGTPVSGGAGGGNVKVVVRVRGFLPREIKRGAECLISMNPDTQSTTLMAPRSSNAHDPANFRAAQSRGKVIEDKAFTFDNSFWSHDREDAHYAEQEDVYNCLGEEFLDHNFEGYHTCIFAYGQTGSGKSYTMMGTEDQPGLIPRTCEDLFQRIESSESPNISYNVRVSYFEVYNEHVRDLLVPRTDTPYYLKIRESPTDGPYVKDLTDVPVRSFAEIMRLMRKGDASRTVASTKMNDTSSRSHAVFTIMLKQIHHDLSTDETTERTARIRLVDLAGSERAKTTEATGQRLREGSNINKSLTTLGRVIAALADNKPGRMRKNKEIVPYRDSILTWLLKDSLGGNSKTAMIACIAPSDYEETLSTLRYADQAKHIRTRAIVNQDHVSAAERDAQIAEMAEIIRTLQVSVNQQAIRKRESEMQNEKLEEYQGQVVKMQRLMEETKMVSECKIRQLQTENDALRRHLKLALESLKNPIPPVEVVKRKKRESDLFSVPEKKVADAAGIMGEGEKENAAPTTEPEWVWEDDEDDDHYHVNGFADAGQYEAMEVQAKMEQLLFDVNFFRQKVADDHDRFGIKRPSSSAFANSGERRVLVDVRLN
ncbi:kinesin heavy chain isoform 5C [Paracoccidioides lutzii Pb01]|uniref:Kinesin-like protein n=1 Tax=Paracoccidioides lutzii (strain ATCC MYA-826 / Pb01) TaxID=502779 RepID=C1GV88_PARBA|nr:kinesin heavy chain isoform 5C [Paracoccidioides lutzii Pb01]EEH40506.2 kinesin heavy chain isoform 5C [Paracoccidioides lutzii Pb01]